MSTPPDRAHATDENLGDSVLPAPAQTSSARKHKRARVPHGDRFRVALATLVGIAVGAIAIAVAVVIANHGTNGGGKTAAWSSWSPSTSGHSGVTEIADHIAPYYRMTAAQQLDVVTPLALTNPNASGTISGSGLVVAVNTGSASSQNLSLLSGHTVAYNVCGIGSSNCALPGTPSTSRLLLLRREALELALYTFKYISGTDNVIAVLPPGKTETSSKLSSNASKGSHAVPTSKPVTIAVLFVKPELQPWLSTPISKTLSQFPPDVSQLPLWSQTNEAGLVDQVTARGLFSSSIESQQGGGNLMVLQSLPPS